MSKIKENEIDTILENDILQTEPLTVEEEKQLTEEIRREEGEQADEIEIEEGNYNVHEE